MDIPEFQRIVREAEAKLAQGRALARAEQVALLAALLMGQATRKEKGYGQS